MAEKPEQTDFLRKLENPEVAIEKKSGIGATPEPAPAEEKFNKKRQKYVSRQAATVNLGWAGRYYGNDLDNPKQ